jgi:MFS family permease
MRSQLRLLRAVVGNPDLRYLGTAWLATSMGAWGGALALSVYAFDEGGVAAVGLVALLRTLPGALVAPLLAVLADRSPRGVMIASAVLRAGVMAALATAAASGAPLGVFYALVVVLALVSPAYAPALVAMIVQVSRTPLELASANIAQTTINNVGFVVGSLLTGLALEAASASAALATVGVAHALATLSLLRLASGGAGIVDEEAHLDEGAELAAGFRAIAADAHLRELTLLIAIIMVVDGALDVLVVIAALGYLGAGSDGAGTLTAVWGVGAVLGGAGVMVLLSRGHLLLGIVAGALAVGGSLAGLAGSSWVLLAGVALLGFGIGFTLIEVAAGTLLQRITPGHVLGRVAGVVEMLSVVGIAVGSFGAAMLSDAFGTRAAILVTAALIPAVVLLRRSAYARMDAGQPVVDERTYRLLRAHPIFAPLPVLSVEQLAHVAQPVQVEDRTIVVRQGDAGDRFFLIARGELAVFVDGVHVRTMHAGDGFGEIALLREAPRTATVQAVGDAVLLAVDYRSFVGAVSGLSRSRRAADRLSSARMDWAAPADLDATTTSEV